MPESLYQWLESLKFGDEVRTDGAGSKYTVIRADPTTRPPTLLLKSTLSGAHYSPWGAALHAAMRNTLGQPRQRAHIPDAPTPVLRAEPKPYPPPSDATPARIFDVALPERLPQDHDRRKACVYRMFNSANYPIYIGSAYDPLKRFREHRNGTAKEMAKPWWYQVHHYTIEWFPNRMLADLAEHTAIVHEEPLVNHSGRKSPYMRTRVRR